jgi:hypothetical protein
MTSIDRQHRDRHDLHGHARRMTVATVFAMLAIEFGVRRVTLVIVKLVTKFFLMASVIAVCDAVCDHISGTFQAHKEQGQDQKLANESSHRCLP